MTNHDDVEHRAYHKGTPELRQVDDQSEDGLMTIRMPIASTGDVRNEGDEPLSRDALDGMARQINDGDVGVFLAHGDSDEITAARYGQTERLGNWRQADVMTRSEFTGDTDDAEPAREADDDVNLLVADAQMPDPETLPDGVGRFREALGILKEQAKRGIGMSASIGWREDGDAPGGNDLMEASIVGIPADPRTVTQSGPAVAVARAAVEAGAEPDALVDAVRAAVMGHPSDDTDHAMTDDTDDAEPEAEQAEDEAPTDDEPAEEATRQDEVLERLLELQENQMEVLQSIDAAVRQEDEDDEEDDDDEDEQATDEDEEDDDEQSADPEAEQAAEEIDDLRQHLDALREGGVDVSDVDLPARDADDTDEERDADEPTGDADPNRDADKAFLRQ